MTDKQIDRMDMHHRVLGLLHEQEAITAPVPDVAVCLAQLDDLMEQAIAHGGQASMNITGVAEDKANRRKDLEKAYTTVQAAAKIVAVANEDNELARWADIVPSTVRKMSQSDLHVSALKLHHHCQPHLAALAALGVGSTQMQALQDATQAYLTAMPAPAYARQESKLHRADLIRVQSEMNYLLRTRMDLLIQLFALTQPHLVARYRLARAMRRHKGRPRKWVDGRHVPAAMRVRTGTFRWVPDAPFMFTNTGPTDLEYTVLARGLPVAAAVAVGKGQHHSGTTADWDKKADMIEVRNTHNLFQGRFMVTIG